MLVRTSKSAARLTTVRSSPNIAKSKIIIRATTSRLVLLLFIRSQKIFSTPRNLKQNTGLQKRKCNPRPEELAADLTGAALDAGESDCRIALSGAAAAIKMQSKKRLPATWLAGDCMNIHISPSQEEGQLAVLLSGFFLAIANHNLRDP